MQVAVMGHCLQALLPADQRTPENRVRAAAEAGIGCVEPFGGTWPADQDCRRTAEVVRREGERHGITFPAFGSNTRLGERGERRAATLAALKREMEACQILGATVLTCAAIDAQPVTPEAGEARFGASGSERQRRGPGPGAGLGLPFERAIPGLLDPLRELAEEAGARGVRIALLSHGALVYLSWHLEWLVRLSDNPSVGVAIDPGNALFYGGEEPEAATRRLAACAALVRVGDWRPRPEDAVRRELAEHGRLSLWESAPLGEGVVDHARCLQILRAAGYEGIVSLKSPGPPTPDAPTALRRAVDRLRHWAEEA